MNNYLVRLTLGLVLVAIGLPSPQSRAADTNSLPAAAVPGIYQVATVKYDWRDETRDRSVPVKIYYPVASKGTFPVIIFSHGLGGSREGYAYLGNYWASHGYVSVHVQHLGSDTAVLQGASRTELLDSMKRATQKTNNILNRPLDISFAIDQVSRLNSEDWPLKGRLDLAAIGVAGHSFGAFTTMAIAGELYVTPSGSELSFPDPRVKAVIAMSTPNSRRNLDSDHAFSRLKIPCFHMTGTEDDSPIGETTPAQRRIPFDHTQGVDDYLVTFNGGDHMIFSGRLVNKRPKDAAFQKLIAASSTAFWDAYLKHDASEKHWLADGGFKNLLGEEGVFEEKLVPEKR